MRFRVQRYVRPSTSRGSSEEAKAKECQYLTNCQSLRKGSMKQPWWRRSIHKMDAPRWRHGTFARPSWSLRGRSRCQHGRIVGPLRSFGATLVPPAIGQILTGPAKIARDSLASMKLVAVSTNLLPGVRLRGSIDRKLLPLCHNGGSE